MIKQLLICFGFLALGKGLIAQDLNKGSLQAGSSTLTSAGSSVRGWVGNKINYVSTDLNSSPTSGIKNSGKPVELAPITANLSPNPVVGLSKLSIKDFNGSYTVRIFDLEGRNQTPQSLLARSFNASTMDVDFSAFPAGSYYVEVKSLDGKSGKTIKIVKSIN